jgi:hypothetical protein
MISKLEILNVVDQIVQGQKEVEIDTSSSIAFTADVKSLLLNDRSSLSAQEIQTLTAFLGLRSHKR